MSKGSTGNVERAWILQILRENGPSCAATIAAKMAHKPRYITRALWAITLDDADKRRAHVKEWDISSGKAVAIYEAGAGENQRKPRV